MIGTRTLPETIEVVNVGLPMFADAVRAQGRHRRPRRLAAPRGR